MNEESIPRLKLGSKVIIEGNVFYLTDINVENPDVFSRMRSIPAFRDIHDYYFLPRHQTTVTIKLSQY